MANVRAAIKQIRKDAKRSLRNQAVRTKLKTVWKKLTAFSAPELKQAQELAERLTATWDRAVSRGVVPKRRADRKKARIAHFLTRLSKP